MFGLPPTGWMPLAVLLLHMLVVPFCATAQEKKGQALIIGIDHYNDPYVRDLDYVRGGVSIMQWQRTAKS